MANDPHLTNGRSPIGHRDELNAECLALPLELPRSLIVTDQTDERDVPAKRGDVGRGVGGAAERRAMVLDPHDGNRRLGRDTGTVAGQVFVENDVAKHKHPVLAELREDVTYRSHGHQFCSLSKSRRTPAPVPHDAGNDRHQEPHAQHSQGRRRQPFED